MIELKLKSRTITPEAFLTQLCPRICPLFLVQQLLRHRWEQLSDQWRACVVTYGIAIAGLQRARRLIELVHSREDLTREVENCGRNNWSPHKYAQSLLIEIESRLMIRDVQEEIASQMRDPPSLTLGPYFLACLPVHESYAGLPTDNSFYFLLLPSRLPPHSGQLSYVAAGYFTCHASIRAFRTASRLSISVSGDGRGSLVSLLD